MRKQPRHRAKTSRSTFGFLMLRAGGGLEGGGHRGTEPNRLRLETKCCSVYFITDNSLDPTR